MKRVFRQILFAYGFLTILPGLGKVVVGPGDTGKSTSYYPIVGLTLGALFIPFGLLRWLSPFALSVVLCVFSLFFSRGLHADGLVDTFDGFLAGRKGREDTLKVMKDSRLGALGFIGAFSLYSLKIAFLHEVLLQGTVWQSSGVFGGAAGVGHSLHTPLLWFPFSIGGVAVETAIGRFPLILSVVPALSRGGVALACALFPYAGSKKGLGRSFVDSVTCRQVLAAFLFMEAFSLLSGNLFGFLLPPVVLLFWTVWGLICMSRIGGMTGDTMGAGVELSELFSLVVVRILFV